MYIVRVPYSYNIIQLVNNWINIPYYYADKTIVLNMLRFMKNISCFYNMESKKYNLRFIYFFIKKSSVKH